MPLAAYGSAFSQTPSQEAELAALAKKPESRIPYKDQQRLPPWQWKDVRWGMGGYITISHILALAGLFYIPQCSAPTLMWALLLWPITGYGITGGNHRLWAHRSYTASPVYRFVLMIYSSIANQGSIWHWARDHRVHHFHSETCADPHDAIRGFWFAHMGWLYLKKDPRVAEAGQKVNLDDLRADPFVMLQKNLDPWWNLFFCFFFPALVAKYGWGESMVNGFFVPGALRYVFVLHSTWFVNSAAHLWGERPYDPDSNPAENPMVSFFAVGEGWHNWHHKYPFDYAASEYGVLRQYNPTKLAIDAAAALGLVTERKRATNMWTREKEKRVKTKAN